MVAGNLLGGRARSPQRVAIELHVPALRDRSGDIPLLVEHILKRHARNMGLATPSLDAAALQQLSRYSFPGNVRELENILERAITLCDGTTIHAADLHLPQHGSERRVSGTSRSSMKDSISKPIWPRSKRRRSARRC